MEFIVKQSSVSDNEVAESDKEAKKRADGVSLGELRTLCDQTLFMLATGLDGMEPVLWPLLIEFVTPTTYASAVGNVLRCSCEIVKKRRARGDDVGLDYESRQGVNLPSR